MTAAPGTSSFSASTRPRARLAACLAFLAVAGGAAGAVSALSWGSTGGRAGGPRLARWDDPVVHLGEGKEGQVLTGTIRLRNVGDAPLDFEIGAGCNCTELVPRSGRSSRAKRRR